MRVCVGVCVRLCGHVCACVRREIKLPFQDNTISLEFTYLLDTPKFCIKTCGTMFSCFKCAGDVTFRGSSNTRIN